MLCPPRDRHPNGHTTTGVGSSGFSAGLVSLPAIHELPLDDSSGDADSKVNAHPPCPIQIGVCPQSRQTPDLGTPASQLTAVGHTQDCAATETAAVFPHHFLDAGNAFLSREEDPSHLSWASCSEPPAPMHNTNAIAELSACNRAPATLGQHNDCPDRDDTGRTRPVTTPSVPPSHDLRPLFVPLEDAYAAYDTSLTYISDDVVLFWHPPSVFSRWTLSPFTVDLVEYNCAEQFTRASKARLFGDETALSAILASDDPREQKRLGRQVRHFHPELWQSECENIVFHGNFAKCSPNEEMHLALIQTGDRRLAEASPHDNLWGIGLSACDPRASSPDSWCGQNLLGQALEYARENLRRDITAPLSNPTPETPVPRDDIGDTVFELDPITHLRLDTLAAYANVFSSSKLDYGECSLRPFEIKLPPGTQPIQSRPYRLNSVLSKQVDAILDSYLAAGLIQHSASPWSSSLVCVPKKSGGIRITVNYQKLNKVTEIPQIAIPRVDEVLDTLGGGSVFSVFDLFSGFTQLTIHPDTIPLTAFFTPNGLYERLRMPQGASGAPDHFNDWGWVGM